MTGYGDDWGSWKPHPSLAKEWNEFSNLASQGPHNLDISKLCMKLLSPIDGSVKASDDMADTSQDRQLSEPMSLEDHSSPPLPLTQFNSQAFPYLSQPTKDHDVESLVMELNAVLESHSIPLSEDLVSSLSDFPQQAYPQLLKRLQEELSSEGLQTLCELACEDIQGSIELNIWLHPALICKFILLPTVTNEGECSKDVYEVLEVFARSCPKIVIVQILEPLLLNEELLSVQEDLVKRVIPALPDNHHLHLIKFILEQCATPLTVSNIKVLTIVLVVTTADSQLRIADNAVLTKLTTLLEKSSTSLADNEQFSNFLLLVIRRLLNNSPQPVKNRITNVVRQNKSFNRETLLDALKEQI